MAAVQENVLRSISCDEGLWLNSENDTDVLNSIWKCFTRLCPSISEATQEESGGYNSNAAGVSELSDLPQPPEPALLTTDQEVEDATS